MVPLRYPTVGRGAAILAALALAGGAQLGWSPAFSGMAEPSSSGGTGGLTATTDEGTCLEDADAAAHRVEPGTMVEGDGIVLMLEATDPMGLGGNDATVRVTAADGEPVVGALVFVAIRMPSMDHGVSAYPAEEFEDGRYRASDVSLGMPGEWLMSVEVVRQARAPLVAIYTIAISEP